MWPCKRKIDEEKLKYHSLAPQNSFGPAFLHRSLTLVNIQTVLQGHTNSRALMERQNN
jgi:hypothetical protein